MLPSHSDPSLLPVPRQAHNSSQRLPKNLRKNLILIGLELANTVGNGSLDLVSDAAAPFKSGLNIGGWLSSLLGTSAFWSHCWISHFIMSFWASSSSPFPFSVSSSRPTNDSFDCISYSQQQREIMDESPHERTADYNLNNINNLMRRSQFLPNAFRRRIVAPHRPLFEL